MYHTLLKTMTVNLLWNLLITIFRHPKSEKTLFHLTPSSNPTPIEFNQNPITFTTPTCIPNKNTTCTCAKVAATVGIPWDEGCASTRVELHRLTRSLPEITLVVVGVGESFLRGVFQVERNQKVKNKRQHIFWCPFLGVLRCLLLNLKWLISVFGLRFRCPRVVEHQQWVSEIQLR